MDSKLREDLYKKYVSFLESQLEVAGGAGAQQHQRPQQHGISETELNSAATAFLSLYQVDPAHRFWIVRFYEIAENALRTIRSSSLEALETAFATLETICTNLLLYPWKKEFRTLKTFTGPYVYCLQSALCESDLRSLLRSMGYSKDQELLYHAREAPGGFSQLRQLAFELFLARMECRLLKELVSQAGGGLALEVEAVEIRRISREDARGCAEALCHQEALIGEVSRLFVQRVEPDRAYLKRGGRPSKSVDVTDGAGHWQPATKPVLKASLSLRKEPLFVDAEEDQKDEIIRPTPSLLSVAGNPYSPVADFFPVPPSSLEQTQHSSYPYMSSLEEVDLYTDRSGFRLPSRQQCRDPRDGRENWGSKSPAASTAGMKCQICGLGTSSLAACQKCDMIMCPSCHADDHSSCCGMQDFPKVTRPSEGYLPVKEKICVYSSTQSQVPEKTLSTSKFFPGKTGTTTSSGSRCGFCNKPGASNTCLQCSKVSCDSCIILYAKDICGRKNMLHNFASNNQLNYKSSSISHLVYR
ncbi:spermatogenesis-associated protein 2 [Erpetoichthys calabaricus]|uniref:Spermatogenesis associated 2 n=1 Tax=Erpetoichthys calabaricus TaxID=27687 RepID=A0A8C4S803_ERPCA|nr:spermatogenesis-associated protein 2 [Erpetoichthys calabaricus]XP_028667584.1 spermatogenesis-associated protein 2 [Erpetoichthys calabaricus]XP_028667585.1 spermatogenesis-associated protein 2 [Erpetoichthys calabaricus]